MMNRSTINHAIVGCALGIAAPVYELSRGPCTDESCKQPTVIISRETLPYYIVAGALLGTAGGIARSKMTELMLEEVEETSPRQE